MTDVIARSTDDQDTGRNGGGRSRLGRYATEVMTYGREAAGLRDFLRIMRVRLSQSKVGRLVCPHPIVVEVGLKSLGSGVWLRSHTTDISVLGEILIVRNYEVAARAAGEATTIVDLGANTGLAARWLLQRFPSARLVSVEPEPSNVAVLRHNLAPYGDRAHVIHACAGGRERRVALVGSAGNEWGYSMVDATEGDVDVVTMPRVLEELGADHIDLLKCDIEGAEAELFETSAPWATKVGILAIECHGAFTAERLAEVLSTNGVSQRELRFEATPQFGCEQAVLALNGA